MNEFTDWLIHIPQYLGEFGNWLTSPISDLITLSPLQIVGVGALGFVMAVIIAKVIHLIIG